MTIESSRRDSRMELLRLFAIFSIVVFHCAYKSGFTFSEPTLNAISIKMLWFGGELGVNLFILITGFYQINGRYNSRKLIRIVFEILFYWYLAVVIGIGVGVFRIENIGQLATSLFPILFGKWWYATAFVLIYILSPYLNQFAKNLTARQFAKFLLLTLFLWCLLPTLFGVFGSGPEGLLFYTRLLWLTLMYFLGAYISRFGLRAISNLRLSVILTALSTSFLAASVIIIARYPDIFSQIGIIEWAYFWPPNTVPMLALSLGVFGIFRHISLSNSSFINRMASTTLGIYLLHDSILANWLWKEVLGLAAYENSPWVIPAILASAIAICIAGGFIDLARQQLEKAIVVPLLNSHAYDKLAESSSKFVDKICSFITS